MNIVYSSSAYYFKPTFVSVYSLLKNSSEIHKVHLLSSGVSEVDKASLKKMVEGFGSKFEVIEIEDLLEEKAKKHRFPVMRGNYSTYARIFLAEILPHAEEVLLIDSDTLVLGDVKDIRSASNDKVMLACRDYVISNIFSRHEDSSLRGVEYWNMGVLYINLLRWRELDLTKYLEDNIDRNYLPKIADQSIINKHLGDWIDTINIKYNYYTYFHYGFTYEYYKQYNNATKFLSRDELLDARKTPIIIHFIGTWYERPWFKKNISSFSNVYLSYWTDCFEKKELFQKPKLPFKNWLYDAVSLGVYNILGPIAYFNFRYRVVQAIKSVG